MEPGSSDDPPLKAGASVRVVGLVKAAQHNGKVGRVSAKAGKDGRVGVELSDGQVLSVRRENLEVLADGGVSGGDLPLDAKPRTLQRDNALLLEYDGSRDPDVLALYWHFKDQAFDCFNAVEYIEQMLRYYANGMSVIGVLPRRIRDNEYFLVCLRHEEDEKNSLCQVGFQCMRQFAGISMLVKKQCFTSHRPGAPMAACQVACFASKECEADFASRTPSYAKLCRLIDSSTITVEEEVVQIQT